MAENSLMHEELRQFLSSRSLIDASETTFTYGDGPSGSTRLRHALADFFQRYFRPATPLAPEHLVVTNGVTSAIEHVAWALANPGEGILVGRPYYRAFVMDMEQRASVHMVPVSFEDVDPFGPACTTRYEEALLESRRNGVPIRAILLCHPHNPLGRCYSIPALQALMQLCEKYQIHLISDEIYALSTWHNALDSTTSTSTTPFTSLLSLPTTNLIDPNLVHVLWGPSKDLGANGLRLGVVASHNTALLSACRASAIFSSPSSLAETALHRILTNQSFLAYYIAENRRRLAEAYRFATDLLRQYDIDYLPGATAGFFLWVDLGKKLGSRGGADVNQEIFNALLQRRIFVVSGESAGAELPGWFRLVFSQRREVVAEAIQRIAETVVAMM
ncbi:hypothetical protein SVAN01_11685 [Stagonosporopsis vannaccii]|nr:hypothetical protein SVAN01_11685 [Stagonosporopsis vannaccii]